LTIGNGSDAVVVSGMSNGNGGIKEGLRVRFSVEQATVQAPEHADITITNLSDATANKIQKEYDKVVLEIGYDGDLSTIFSGEIVQKRKGRENPTDTYLHILAKAGQQAYSYGVVNKTLAAGHTLRDQVDACLEAMKPYGIVAGQIADLGAMTFPRGRALFGMAKEHLRWICSTAGAQRWVSQGKLNIVKNNGYLPGSAIVLNSRTGLIGMPVQTMGGIEARCLINTEIKPGVRVQIDQASIQQQAISTNYQAEAQNENIPDIAADGIYKVLYVKTSGDTRGMDWYMDIICFAIGSTKGLKSISMTVLDATTN
jgi:hypothetical protein